MRIVFMGTPDFAVASLDELIKSGQNVVAVVTAPDRPAGRGRKMQQSAIKQYATQNELYVLQPTNLKNEEWLEQLKELKPDLIVVVAFRMLPEAVWKLPPRGTINLHASLLPQYRGAAPINWAIINGEPKTGVTTFFINENIDTGAIIDKTEVSIDETDDAGALHDKLMMAGAKLLANTVSRIESGTAESKPQIAANEIKQAPKIFKEDTVINFDQPVSKVYNFIRGLNPYPSATSTILMSDHEYPVKIFEVEKTGELAKANAAGHVQTDNRKTIKIACKDEWLQVKSLQIAGKKRMSTQELLNGFQLEKGAKMA